MWTNNAFGQNRSDVKISVVDGTIKHTLRIIERSTNFIFSYNEKTILLNKKIKLIVEDESIYQVLLYLARNNGLTFHRINSQIVINKSNSESNNLVTDEENGTQKSQAFGTLRGFVANSLRGEPLPYANVSLFVKDHSLTKEISYGIKGQK